MRSSVAHPWNQDFGTIASRSKRAPVPVQTPRQPPQSMRGQPSVPMPGPSRQQPRPAGLIIPRAKVVFTQFILFRSVFYTLRNRNSFPGENLVRNHNINYWHMKYCTFLNICRGTKQFLTDQESIIFQIL